MNRRTVLAGVGSMGTAAIAGCSGILGGGGGCSISPDSASDLLPDDPEGFTEQNTREISQGDNIDEGAQGTYTNDGGTTFFVSVVKYESSDAADEEVENASEEDGGDIETTTLFVQDGEWIVAAGAMGDVDESTLRDLLGETSLSSTCVENAQAP